jgi:integrase
MAIVRIKYVKTYNSRGRRYFYFRRRGINIPLPGPPGSAEFNEAYAMALDAQGQSRVGAHCNAHGSVAALIGLYGETTHFNSLAARTRAQNWVILGHFRDEHGHKPVARLERRHMLAVLAKLKPSIQRNWTKALKPMFEYGVEIGWIKTNPLRDIKIRYKSGDGFTPWTSIEIEAFRDRHPLGTMARLAFELLLGTCMRSSDVIKLGPQNIWAGKLTRKTKKTGAVLTLPILPELKAALDAMPATDALTFLVNKHGQPYKQRDWNYAFAAWVAAAGLAPVFRPHGLRHTGLTRLANCGASPHVIQAWSGHRTLALISRYTKTADQARLAEEGANILTKEGKLRSRQA